MSSTTLSFVAPISEADLATPHPVLKFYQKYSVGFDNLYHTDPLRFYADSSTITFPDGKVLQGASKIWVFYQQIYGSFGKTTGECLSLHLLSDEATGTYTLHMELIRSLRGREDGNEVKVPQYFVYSIGKADPGAGSDGLQIHGVRCYYDYSLLKSAADAIGVDTTTWKTVDIEA